MRLGTQTYPNSADALDICTLQQGYMVSSSKKSHGPSRVQLLMIPFALTLGLGGGVGWYIWDTYQAFEQVHKQYMRLQELASLNLFYDEALTMSAQMAVATGDRQWEQRYRKLEPIAQQYQQETDQLLPSDFAVKKSDRFLNAADRLFAIENQALQAVQAGRADEGRRLLNGQEYTDQKEIYIQEVESITQSLQAYIDQVMGQQTQQALVSLIGFGILLSLLAVAWMLALQMLRRYIQEIDQTGNTISVATQQINATLQDQERFAAQQSAAVSQTTTTMDELGTASKHSSEQASAALSGAQEALDLAGDGKDLVEKTLEGMEMLRQKVEAIASQTTHLSDQTSQISSIINLVSDLANQTNMLALNASVEAVRAGEHGKGFGVVATEIRKLADQSKRSAERIDALLSEIQSAIHTTVIVTDEGQERVQQGLALAKETTETFRRVTDSINHITLNSQQISLTSRQQAIAIAQIVEAMNALNQGVAQTAAGISQTKQSVQSLNQSAHNLQALVIQG